MRETIVSRIVDHNILGKFVAEPQVAWHARTSAIIEQAPPPPPKGETWRVAGGGRPEGPGGRIVPCVRARSNYYQKYLTAPMETPTGVFLKGDAYG